MFNINEIINNTNTYLIEITKKLSIDFEKRNFEEKFEILSFLSKYDKILYHSEITFSRKNVSLLNIFGEDIDKEKIYKVFLPFFYTYIPFYLNGVYSADITNFFNILYEFLNKIVNNEVCESKLENYNYVLKHIYSFCKIDFSKYEKDNIMDKDDIKKIIVYFKKYLIENKIISIELKL